MADDRTRRVETILGRRLTRRELLLLAAYGGSAAAAAAFIAACSPAATPSASAATTPAASAPASASAAPSTAAGRTHQDRLRQSQDRTPRGVRGGRRLHPRGIRRRPFGAGVVARRHDLPDRDRGQGQPVRPEPRRARWPASSSLDDKVDLMLVASTPRRPTRSPTSARRTACPASPRSRRGSRASSRRQRRPGRPQAVRLDLPLLLGPRGHHRGLHRHVGPGQHQQDASAGSVPERRRRQRLGRSRRSASPAALADGRLHASSIRAATRTSPRTSRRRSLPSRTANVRDPDRRPDPARLHDLLEAGGAAGLQAEGRVDRQGAALPVLGRGPRRRSARACRPRSGGRPTHPVHVVPDGRDAPRSSPTATRPRPASSGPSRSASPTPCSRWPPTP